MTYTPDFYTTEDEIAAASAALTLPPLFARYPSILSVIDVGCGTGAWAHTAQQHHRIAVGVDHHVPVELRRPITYVDCDLSNGYPCTGFDLAICLEVAEHLPAETAPALVNGLARARIILFSAATPGQPGVGHVNCQPHEYWHDQFLTYGFQWEHHGPTLPVEVADFYRRNMFIYERTP
jgi:SAM-dependent methyltransferase